MNDASIRSLERPAYGALVSFLLAPVIAHGLWLPLVHFLGPSGSSGAITGAALAITAAIVVVQALRPAGPPLASLAVGGLIATGATIAFSLGLAGLLALLAVAAAVGSLMRRLPPRLPPALDGLARRHKILTAIYLALALAVVVSVARVSVFIGDSSRVEQQVVPGEKFLETHSCLTAYVRASTLSRQRVDNLYHERWWHGSHGLPAADGERNPYQPFLLDYYAYPPPFLLIMAPLAPLEGDFAAQRALWFGLNGLLLAIGLGVVARWIDGPSVHRSLLLAPILAGSLPVLATLQIGNFQIAVVLISVLAMVAFHQDRPAVGGALLAFAILSKLSPALLGVTLLAQRRWRAAAWAAGFGVFFVALSALMTGLNPMASFLTYMLSRLGSGEAFSFLDDSNFNILTNMAPFGLPFKLQLLGLDVGDPWVVGRRIGRLYTILLVILAIVAARRPGDRRAQAVTWMSLLVLSATQSPFAPGYTVIALLWATTLLAVEVRALRGGLGIVLLWVGLTIVLPTKNVSVYAIFSILQGVLTVGVPTWLILRAPPGPAPQAALPSGSAELLWEGAKGSPGGDNRPPLRS